MKFTIAALLLVGAASASTCSIFDKSTFAGTEKTVSFTDLTEIEVLAVINKGTSGELAECKNGIHFDFGYYTSDVSQLLEVSVIGPATLTFDPATHCRVFGDNASPLSYLDPASCSKVMCNAAFTLHTGNSPTDMTFKILANPVSLPPNGGTVTGTFYYKVSCMSKYPAEYHCPFYNTDMTNLKLVDLWEKTLPSETTYLPAPNSEDKIRDCSKGFTYKFAVRTKEEQKYILPTIRLIGLNPKMAGTLTCSPFLDTIKERGGNCFEANGNGFGLDQIICSVDYGSFNENDTIRSLAITFESPMNDFASVEYSYTNECIDLDLYKDFDDEKLSTAEVYPFPDSKLTELAVFVGVVESTGERCPNGYSASHQIRRQYLEDKESKITPQVFTQYLDPDTNLIVQSTKNQLCDIILPEKDYYRLSCLVTDPTKDLAIMLDTSKVRAAGTFVDHYEDTSTTTDLFCNDLMHKCEEFEALLKSATDDESDNKETYYYATRRVLNGTSITFDLPVLSILEECPSATTYDIHFRAHTDYITKVGIKYEHSNNLIMCENTMTGHQSTNDAVKGFISEAQCPVLQGCTMTYENTTDNTVTNSKAYLEISINYIGTGIPQLNPKVDMIVNKKCGTIPEEKKIPSSAKPLFSICTFVTILSTLSVFFN